MQPDFFTSLSFAFNLEIEVTVEFQLFIWRTETTATLKATRDS